MCWSCQDVVGSTMGGPINPPHLPWLVYTYGPDGFAWERPMRCNPNVRGYPFPQGIRVVSSLYPPLSFFIFLSFSHSLSLSEYCLLIKFYSLWRSIRSLSGLLGTSSWRWLSTLGRSMDLEGMPTRVMMIMMMAMTLRWLRATGRGRSTISDDPTDTHKQTYFFQLFSFSFLFGIIFVDT